MILSKSIKPIFNWIHLINWVVISILIVNYIFILNSPNWYTVVKVGFIIQFVLVIIFLISTRLRFFYKWFAFDLIAILFIGLMELEGSGIIRIASGADSIQISLLMIAFLNLMFGFSITFILSSFAKKW